MGGVVINQYSDNTVYFSFRAKLPADTPSSEMYKTVDVALIINALTGEIEDVSITLVTREAILFLKQIIIGFNIEEKPLEELLESLKIRYYGEAVKAILVALRGAAIRYLEWKRIINGNKNTQVS